MKIKQYISFNSTYKKKKNTPFPHIANIKKVIENFFSFGAKSGRFNVHFALTVGLNPASLLGSEDPEY